MNKLLSKESYFCYVAYIFLYVPELISHLLLNLDYRDNSVMFSTVGFFIKFLFLVFFIYFDMYVFIAAAYILSLLIVMPNISYSFNISITIALISLISYFIFYTLFGYGLISLIKKYDKKKIKSKK